MKSIQDLHLTAKRVLLRADFNVPMDEQKLITDDTRIRMVLPTIRHILQETGRLIICSHLGRPKGKRVEEFSLDPVANHLALLLGVQVTLAPFLGWWKGKPYQVSLVLTRHMTINLQET